MLERVGRKGKPPTLLLGVYIGITNMGNQCGVSSKLKKKKKKNYNMIQESYSWAYHERKSC